MVSALKRMKRNKFRKKKMAENIFMELVFAPYGKLWNRIETAPVPVTMRSAEGN